MTPTAGLTEELTDALWRVARHATLPRFVERVAHRAGVHLDRSAYVLLAQVVDRPLRIGELADRLSVDISTVSRQLQALEAAGLAHRERHPTDRRGWLVVADPDGTAALEAHRQARREIFDELLDDLPADQVATAAAVLDRLADRLATLEGCDPA
jgi:DNA-binding MarR family transcriptional regulator